MTVRLRTSAPLHSQSHIARSSAALPTRRMSTPSKPTCDCAIAVERIRHNITQGQREPFKQEMKDCKRARDYQKWETYHLEHSSNLDRPLCKAFEAIKATLPQALLDQTHIKSIDAETSTLFESNLYILESKPGQVSYAGEGGRHVGKKEYWKPIFDRLNSFKHLSVHVISIGGGIGFDAHAISAAFREENFDVQQSVVVDPNQLAAFLSEKVDYYVTISQNFFQQNFNRKMGNIYVFHLGTTLNVVPEHQTIQIIQQIADKMQPQDILSLIMVDKKQFERGRALAFCPETEEGFAKIINKKTGKHYKTVIANPEKFIHFMAKLGFQGELVEFTEKNVPLEVAFVAYKTLKENPKNK